ncbi:MAG TPA: alpha/beta hydrolase [Solirubrobacterales bacterium]|jgi:pimeloyl-ACP methyl ester carboxylesterase|nr:alpha/beta hydrolase [Solirubrobacterales bacterium]
MGSFRYHGQHSLSYDVYGDGDRVLVLTHGLLMNRRMYERLAPEMVARGNRVICLDLLGHGRSDRPDDPRLYSMTAFADQTLALLDHLELEQAVIGGTSLGANVGLEFAAWHPDRVKGLFVEMPVLEDALTAVAVIFAPILASLRFGAPVFRAVARVTSRIPRTNYFLDLVLDWIRQDPEPSVAVLEGLLLGRSAPPQEDRMRIEAPALVFGHPADPLHPFNDADELVDEMPNARLVNASSILEWRTNPERLNDELAAFLDEVWAQAEPAAEARTAAS